MNSNKPLIDTDDGTSEPDIVEVILAQVRAVSPAITVEELHRVEVSIRAQFGGRRMRIPKRKKHPTEAERALVVKDGLSSAPNEEIQARHKISRATLYRYMKK